MCSHIFGNDLLSRGMGYQHVRLHPGIHYVVWVLQPAEIQPPNRVAQADQSKILSSTRREAITEQLRALERCSTFPRLSEDPRALAAVHPTALRHSPSPCP
jgi:hypothetical protein